MNYEDIFGEAREDLKTDEALVLKFNRMTKKFLDDNPPCTLADAHQATLALLTIPMLGLDEVPDDIVMQCVYDMRNRIMRYHARGLN